MQYNVKWQEKKWKNEKRKIKKLRRHNMLTIIYDRSECVIENIRDHIENE